jgi:hypothetical protein
MSAFAKDVEKSIGAIEAAWKERKKEDAAAFKTAAEMFGDVQGLVAAYKSALTTAQFPFLKPAVALSDWSRDGNTVSAYLELESAKKPKVAIPLRTLIGEPMVTVGDRSFSAEEKGKILAAVGQEIVAFFLP